MLHNVKYYRLFIVFSSMCLPSCTVQAVAAGPLQLDVILYRPMVVRRNRIIICTMCNGYWTAETKDNIGQCGLCFGRNSSARPRPT